MMARTATTCNYSSSNDYRHSASWCPGCELGRCRGESFPSTLRNLQEAEPTTNTGLCGLLRHAEATFNGQLAVFRRPKGALRLPRKTLIFITTVVTRPTYERPDGPQPPSRKGQSEIRQGSASEVGSRTSKLYPPSRGSPREPESSDSEVDKSPSHNTRK